MCFDRHSRQLLYYAYEWFCMNEKRITFLRLELFNFFGYIFFCLRNLFASVSHLNLIIVCFWQCFIATFRHSICFVWLQFGKTETVHASRLWLQWAWSLFHRCCITRSMAGFKLLVLYFVHTETIFTLRELWMSVSSTMNFYFTPPQNTLNWWLITAHVIKWARHLIDGCSE